MKIILSLLVISLILFSQQADAQLDMYLPSLVGKRFKCVIDAKSGEFRTYRFVEADGKISGVQEQYVPVNDPDEGLIMAPMFDYILAFEIEANESCGYCMVFKMEDETEKYFVADHVESDFWIQEVDKTFSKFDENTKYLSFEMEGDGEEEALREITATSTTSEKHYTWGEVAETDSWISPGKEYVEIEGISVSSVLPEDENFDYEMVNLFDDNPNTTWFSNPETNEEYPKDESVIFTITMNSGNESIWILNGMQYSEEDFENNGRIKTLTVYINDEPFATVTLLDQMGPQEIELSMLSAYTMVNKTIKVEFRIIDIYPGKEFPEAAITEIYSVR